jgi:hypothetical protein
MSPWDRVRSWAAAVVLFCAAVAVTVGGMVMAGGRWVGQFVRTPGEPLEADAKRVGAVVLAVLVVGLVLAVAG